MRSLPLFPPPLLTDVSHLSTEQNSPPPSPPPSSPPSPPLNSPSNARTGGRVSFLSLTCPQQRKEGVGAAGGRSIGAGSREERVLSSVFSRRCVDSLDACCCSHFSLFLLVVVVHLQCISSGQTRERAMFEREKVSGSDLLDLSFTLLPQHHFTISLKLSHLQRDTCFTSPTPVSSLCASSLPPSLFPTGN